MKLFRRAAALMLSVCTMLTCASCGENTAQAMTVDGKDVRAGIYLYYVISAYNDAISVMSDNGEDFSGVEESKDFKKILKKANIDNVHADEWIQNKAVEYCQTFVAVEKEFDNLGLTLSGQDLAAIDKGVESNMSLFGEFYEDTGIGEQSVRDVVTFSYKQNAIWKAYYGEGGSEGVQEQELYDHYKDNHIRIKYIEMPLKDGEGNLLKSDGKEEIEKMAQDYLARLGKKSDSEKDLMEEFDYLIDEHANYVTSLSNAAITTTDDEGNQITTETTAKSTTTEKTQTEDQTGDETGAQTTTAATAAETTTTAAETTTAADQTGTETTTTTTETTAAAETTSAKADVTGGGTDTTKAAETTTDGTGLGYSTDKEHVLAVSTSASEDEHDHEETTTEPTYTPCEKVYNWAVDPATKYNTPELIKDDETYYIAVKMDIEERMTSGDLWTESQIESVRTELYRDEFDDKLGEMGKALEVKRNEKAFRRYKVLDVDIVKYQQLLYQSYYSMFGGS